MHHVAPLQLESSVECDIVVAGGSLASLAAAVTAANVSSALNVCFLEITDWPGGQMTASGVPAIDFGTGAYPRWMRDQIDRREFARQHAKIGQTSTYHYQAKPVHKNVPCVLTCVINLQ